MLETVQGLDLELSEGVSVQKRTTHHHRAAGQHARPALRHPAKTIAVRKAAAARAAASGIALVPKPEPKVIEVMELDFVDPDILPHEEAAVTGFDDEDF